jgi:protocatechuate 3,4-dioxygenase beta subunit
MKHPHDDHDDHGGLHRDLRALARFRPTRRRMLGLLAGASVIPIVGCGSTTLAALDGGVGDGGGTGSCPGLVPQETGGPYPGDGSNGPNILTQAGVVRSDIRSSIGTASGIAAGVPLSVTLSLVDAGCAPLAGLAIYAWHCNRDGFYSMYSPTIASENYLRGVQETDAFGNVTFSTIYPACYSGRWPHIHFEVYPSLAAATGSANAMKTSQLAMPSSTNDVVFATSGYEQSVTNVRMVSLASDNVFSDGATLETPTMGGSVDTGLTAALRVAIAI